MEIFTHPMDGFDKAKLIEFLQLTDNQNPLCVIALGYLDDAEKLEKTFKGRELTVPTPRPLEEMLKIVFSY